MIRFALRCAAGHAFEGWFSDSAAFEQQSASGALACPVCGGSDVRKGLMAPAIATDRRKEVKVAAHVPPVPEPEALAMLRKIRAHLTENAEYVGNRFAEEARRIHFDEAEKRGIYGEATSEEVRALAEEEIEFHPLPVLPEDHH
jgi:hypothetical protein